MRIESISTPQIQTVTQRPGAPALPDQLQPGTRVQAQVISREGDTVQLRLEGGAELTARLEGGAFLVPGQEVQLLVTDRSDQSATMSLERGAASSGGQPQAESEAANTLRSLRLPVTDEIVQRMESLLRNNPSLPADRAAFLAANGIEEPGLVQAAQNLMEQGATTGQMLDRLMELLPEPLPGQAIPIDLELPELPLPEQAAEQLPLEQLPPEQALPEQPLSPPPGGQPEQAAAMPREIPALPTAEQLPAEQALPQAAQQPPPEQPAATEQNASPEQLLQQALSRAVQQQQAPQVPIQPPAEQLPPEQAQPAQAPPPQAPPAETAAPQDWVQLLEQLLGAQPEPPPAAPPDTSAPQAAAPQAPPEQTAQTAQAAPELPEAPLSAPTAAPEAPQQADAQRVLSLLSSMPAMEQLSDRNLIQLSSLLERAVPQLLQELQQAPDQATALRHLLNGLFASVERDGDTAQQLRQAKEELYLKLSLFRDAVQRSDAAQKPALLQETQKLMDHVRTMGEIDQFVYLQVPLMMEGRHETAELYFFKNTRQGRKRIDPEDVQILLALDLEHMGHLESLVHIRGREVSLNLELESDEAVAFTQRETPRLFSLLDDAGFKLTDAKITRAAERTTPAGALLTLLRHERSRAGYDLTI